jgi:anti-anti-sigma factor
MLKPTAEVRLVEGILVAEFWDCLRLDPVAVTQLRAEVEAHLGRRGRPDLVIDLNGVSFAGSSALGGFLAIQKLCRQQGGRVLLCNVDPTVREVFRVSKLDGFFGFAADVPAALARLSESADVGAAPSEPAAEPESSSPPSRPPLRGRRRPT